MLEDDNTASETFELYGPSNYSMAEIASLVDREIFKKRRHINVPKVMMQPAAKLLNQVIWWKTTSADEVEREFLDQKIDPKAKTFKDLGIEPGELANFTFHYLVRLTSCIIPTEYANSLFLPFSKGIGVLRSMICHPRRSERSERRRNIFTSSTTNELDQVQSGYSDS